jgi:hypothetical protein
MRITVLKCCRHTSITTFASALERTHSRLRHSALWSKRISSEHALGVPSDACPRSCVHLPRGSCLRDAVIITSMPNIGLSWDSIHSVLISTEGTMAQHLLMSAQPRTLSHKEIYQSGEDEADDTFCKLRWPETNGSPPMPMV